MQFFVFILCNTNPVLATTETSSEIEWQNLLGGESSDACNSMQPTKDGGYILVGTTYSTGGDVSGYRDENGRRDIWVVKVDANGVKLWQKCLGGSMDDIAFSIQQTNDGGYIVGGGTRSVDGDAIINRVPSESGFMEYDSINAWVIKLDAGGEIQWQKQFGGSLNEYIRDIQQTSDGGYIFTGSTTSMDYDLVGRNGYFDDIWVVKLDDTGEIEWQKCLGGDNYDYSTTIRQLADGGYIVAGYTGSTDDSLLNHGNLDAWVAKLDANGAILWQKCLGGTRADVINSIEKTADGGYIAAGHTKSNDGDLLFGVGESLEGLPNHGNYDLWIMKLDKNGTLQWQRCLGGSAVDYANSVKQTADGGYVIVGITNSTDGDILFGVEESADGMVNHGGDDAWIVKLDADGTLLWQKSVGGSSNEYVTSI